MLPDIIGVGWLKGKVCHYVAVGGWMEQTVKEGLTRAPVTANGITREPERQP